MAEHSFFGDTSTPIKLGEIDITVSLHAARYRAPTHFHRQPYACIVLEGLISESSNGKTRQFEPGAACFHPTHHEHSDSFHTAAKCLNLTCKHSQNNHEVSFRKTKRTLSWAKSIASELENPVFDPLSLEVKALALLNDFDAKESRAWVAASRQITDRWFDRRLSVAWLSDALDVHPVHFARVFRATTGVGYESYLNSVRLKAAQYLLLETCDSVTNISYQCGFSEPSAFSRAFHARFGTSPRSYRQSN